MKKILLAAMAVLVSVSLMAAPKKAAQTETVVYSVHLHCANCVKKVQENISFEKGVKDLKCSLEEGKVTVTFDPAKTSVEKLEAAIEKLGYEATVVKDGCCGHCGEGEHKCGEGCQCGGHHEGKACCEGHEHKDGCCGEKHEGKACCAEHQGEKKSAGCCSEK